MKYSKHFANLLRDTWRQRRRPGVDPKVMVIAPARCLYVPVPKAANTSARVALAASIGLDPESIVDVHKDARLPVRRLSQTGGLAEGWWAFTLTRDPAQRALSAWRNKIVDRGAELRALRAMGLEAGDGFETFLAACLRWPRQALNDHLMPQSDLLRPLAATGRLTTWRSEDLPAAWAEITQRIEAAGASPPSPIGHANRTGGGGAAAISPRAARLIARLYAEDYAKFDYEPPASA